MDTDLYVYVYIYVYTYYNILDREDLSAISNREISPTGEVSTWSLRRSFIGK